MKEKSSESAEKSDECAKKSKKMGLRANLKRSVD